MATYVIQPASDPGSGNLSLRPDATYFALSGHGRQPAMPGVTKGDYVLFEAQSEATNGALIATSDWRRAWASRGIPGSQTIPCWSRMRTGQPAVILTDGGARGTGCSPNTPLAAARGVLARGRCPQSWAGAVLIFQPVNPVAPRRRLVSPYPSMHPSPGDLPPIEAESGTLTEDFAAIAAPNVIPVDRPDPERRPKRHPVV